MLECVKDFLKLLTRIWRPTSQSLYVYVLRDCFRVVRVRHSGNVSLGSYIYNFFLRCYHTRWWYERKEHCVPKPFLLLFYIRATKNNPIFLRNPKYQLEI